MPELREARFEMPWLPPAILRGNSRAGWRARQGPIRMMRRTTEYETREWLIANGGALIGRVAVQYEFHTPSASRCDPDNFIIGMKSWLDGVRDSGLIAGDSSKHVTLAAPRFVSCKRGEEHTIVTITENEVRT